MFLFFTNENNECATKYNKIIDQFVSFSYYRDGFGIIQIFKEIRYR